ncbi:hypothetical protein CNY67_12130 [Desulfovibrio sp. G11]|nr:hypothetical protein CNY67_12130 [Desulfovibrio sp. G11]
MLGPLYAWARVPPERRGRLVFFRVALCDVRGGFAGPPWWRRCPHSGCSGAGVPGGTSPGRTHQAAGCIPCLQRSFYGRERKR